MFVFNRRTSELIQVDTLYCGEVGYMSAQIKSVVEARVGDTITQSRCAAGGGVGLWPSYP